MGKSFKKVESEVKEEFYQLVLNVEISDFEREKLLIAKNLIESGEFLPNVLRRIQVTFTGLALKNDLSPAVSMFYASLPKKLREVQI